MASPSQEQIQSIRQRLLVGMFDYMTNFDEDPSEYEWDCSYSQKDIDECIACIDDYLAKVTTISGLTAQQIEAAVQKLVVELNELNNKCGGSLIETDQREYICEIILIAAKDAGLTTDEDITEPWRQW
jgi:hypothetical protein